MTRKEKALRILNVQQQMQRIEDIKLATLQNRLNRLETEQNDIISALNADDALQGLFVDTMAKRLRSLSETAKQTATARDDQSQRVIERTRQVKCAERLSNAVSQAEDKMIEEKQLRESIDLHLVKRDASLP